MLGEAIGSTLAAAMGIALSPLPIIGVVLILSSRNGLRNGSLFAAGWAVGLLIIAGVTLLFLGGADDAESSSSTIADLLRLAAGGGLVALGLRKGINGVRSDEPPKTPEWMASLNEATSLKSFGLGLLLSGVNFKMIVLTASAVTTYIELGLKNGELILAIVIFVLLASCSVAGAVLAKRLGGARADSMLDGVRRFMLANNAIIIAIIFVILGANVFGAGLSGLSN